MLKTICGKTLSISLFLSSLAGTALADNGTLLAGNTYCTQAVQSTGLYFSGGTQEKMTWTVLMSGTATGPTTQIFEAVLQNAAGINVTPSTPGTYFFRACIDNTSGKTGYFTLWAAGLHGAVAPLAGPSVATLGPQGSACAQFAEGPANRVGQSTQPVTWSVLQYDGDGNLLNTSNSVTSATVNDTVQPEPGAFMIEMCATNTSASTAMLTLQLLAH